MQQVPVFHGRVTADAKLELDDSERLMRKTLLRVFAGQDVEIIVRKRRVQRSEEQNRYLHAVPFPMLAEFFGYDVDDLKLALMGECWGWKQINGHDVPVKSSTSRMTVPECTHFIEWLVRWALERHDFRIPLPGESEAA